MNMRENPQKSMKIHVKPLLLAWHDSIGRHLSCPQSTQPKNTPLDNFGILVAPCTEPSLGPWSLKNPFWISLLNIIVALGPAHVIEYFPKAILIWLERIAFELFHHFLFTMVYGKPSQAPFPHWTWDHLTFSCAKWLWHVFASQTPPLEKQLPLQFFCVSYLCRSRRNILEA
jgi:hypothetical protein